MKLHFSKSFIIGAFWTAASVLPALGAADPAADNQPAAFQTEEIPNAARTAAPRGGNAGRGGVQANYVAELTPEQLAELHTKLDALNAAIKALKEAKADDDLVVDAESCAWIVETTLRIPNAYGDADALMSPYNKCVSLLETGLRRAQQIKDGTAAWPQLKGRVNRGYRSAVDGTAQPYHVTIPASYDPAKPIALYVYLHGMSHYVPDMGWDWAGGADRAGTAGGSGNYIRVEMFGRGNNSFRWAGETDVLEALASVRKRYNIDPKRILLAGFSMGGAGSWQIGLHNPDLFCGLEIDAGVIGNRLNLDGLSSAQKAATATYGIMIPQAINVYDVPLVGYAGANDAQLAASKSIRAQLEREGFHFNDLSQVHARGTDINAIFLANPGQGHSHATGETLRLIDDFSAHNFERGSVTYNHIRFATYTTRYNKNFWVTIDGLEHHFDRADVDATRDTAKANYTIKTNNISRLLLAEASDARKISIDGDTLDVQGASTLLLVRAGGHWRQGDPAADAGLRKQHNLQGPVNDAFFDAFLCVKPTGTPFNAIADERGLQELDRFAKMFTRDYCGDARTKADTAVTAEDIANNNLILFGDPGSNRILAQIADKLPIKWTKDSITVGDKTYSAADHVPVLIYPNPLNPKHYVVINTGLVSGGNSAGGLGTGYGDYAVLTLTKSGDGQFSSSVAADGVFNEAWQLPTSP